jgi:hypothetical protein
VDFLGIDYFDHVTAVSFDTKITGTGLLHLKGLVNLEVLDVSGSPVTDAGLEHLHGLTELGELNLCGTKVTRAGFEFLGQELSSTSVVH